MFSSASARYALRACLVGLAAFASTILASDWKHALVGGVLAALGYAGIGAAVPAVEPAVGAKMSVRARVDGRTVKAKIV
jgi:hypothetical protein